MDDVNFEGTNHLITYKGHYNQDYPMKKRKCFLYVDVSYYTCQLPLNDYKNSNSISFVEPMAVSSNIKVGQGLVASFNQPAIIIQAPTLFVLG